MARYIYSIFDDMTPYLSFLPMDQKEHLLRFTVEGMMAAKQKILYAKHTLESAAKTLTTAVALRRHSWLCTTSLPFEMRGLIEDMPFDGKGLFSESTDATLQDLDKSIKTSLKIGYFGLPIPSCPSFAPGLADLLVLGPGPRTNCGSRGLNPILVHLTNSGLGLSNHP